MGTSASTGAGPSDGLPGLPPSPTQPASQPVLSFPSFLLGLVTAIESDPASISQHLGNLAYVHAAPASFTPQGPETQPVETDAIVAEIGRASCRERVS